MRELFEIGEVYEPVESLGDTSQQRTFTGPDDVSVQEGVTLAVGDLWHKTTPVYLPPPPPAGVPLPFLGASGGNNTVATAIESAAGRPVGVHRIYGDGAATSGAQTVANVLATASADVAAGRVPWVSYKLPAGITWATAKTGAADGFAQARCAEMGALPGPVMLTWHHEPEGDQSPGSDFAAMHARLYQFSKPYGNIKCGPVLISYNELHQVPAGAGWGLDTLWPGAFDAGDFIAFDAYCHYGTASGGSWFFLGPTYLTPLAQFAARKGVPWAIGEFGISATAAAYNRAITGGSPDGTSGGDVTWLKEAWQTALDLNQNTARCLAMSYFDSPFASTTNVTVTRNGVTIGAALAGQPAWLLDNQNGNLADSGTPSKLSVFTGLLQQSPTWQRNWP